VTPEGKIKAMVKIALNTHFPKHYKFMPVQTGFGATSLDFLCCIDGWFICIETKAPGKKPTPMQAGNMKMIQTAGGITFVVDSQESCDMMIATVALLIKGRH